MDSPMQWLWNRLETALEPGKFAVLRGEFEAYQGDYGRAQRHQAKIDRLARLREALKNPSSRTHMRNLQDQISKLEAHLKIVNPGTSYTDEELKDVYVRNALSELESEEAK